MKNTRLHLNLTFYLWFLVYLIFIYNAYRVSMIQQHLTFSEMLKGNLFHLQKYFFDISILFIFFLYAMKRPFESIFFISRCRESLIMFVVRYGFKIVIFYTTLTAFLFYIFPFINGFELIFSIEILMNFINLFSFLFAIFLIYIYLLFSYGKQMLAILLTFGINIVMLAIYSVTSYNLPFIGMIINIIFLNLFPTLALLISFLVILSFKKRDFIL